MKALSKAQRVIFRALKEHILRHGESPTHQQLADYTEIKPATVRFHLASLENLGLIVRRFAEKRGVYLSTDKDKLYHVLSNADVLLCDGQVVERALGLDLYLKNGELISLESMTNVEHKNGRLTVSYLDSKVDLIPLYQKDLWLFDPDER